MKIIARSDFSLWYICVKIKYSILSFVEFKKGVQDMDLNKLIDKLNDMDEVTYTLKSTSGELYDVINTRITGVNGYNDNIEVQFEGFSTAFLRKDNITSVDYEDECITTTSIDGMMRIFDAT